MNVKMYEIDMTTLSYGIMQPIEFLSAWNFIWRTCKIVFRSLLNFTHITQWFLFVPIPMLWL